MKSTILHLVPTFEGGGAERQLAALAAEQSRRGSSVHIGFRRSGVYADFLSSRGVNTHVLGDHRGASARLFAGIYALLRRIRPAIVQTWLPQMDIVGGLACLARGTPWILSERASDRAFSKASIVLRARGLLGRQASAVVANSALGAAYWRGVVSPEKPVDVIRNAVDVAAIRGTPPPHRGDWVSGRFFLVVGRLHHQKAVEIVLQAVARTVDPEFRVLILGDGPLRAQLEATIQELRLGNRVVMLPYQPDWWGLLKVATALVSVSRYEGHPNVVLEAMAAGCPLIVSDIPEHREFLSETSAVMVPKEDPVALAQAMQAALHDQGAARQRAEIAADQLGDLGIESIVDAYERLYQQVMRARSTRCAA